MESGITQAGRTQGTTRQVVVGQPIPLLGLLFAVFACGASSLAWLWFTSPKPNYILNLVVPMLVLVIGGVVAPMLVFFVGGFFGLFKLDVYRFAAPGMTHLP